MRFAGVRPAEPVGAQIVTTFGWRVARSALRFAFDAAAEPLRAIEVAALFAGRTRETFRNARSAAAEAIDTIEVAAVDRRCAGKAFRSADLLGFALTVRAKQIAAARLLGRARIAKLGAHGLRISEQVEISRARTAGSEREHEDRDECACRSHASGKRRTHARSLEGPEAKRNGARLPRCSVERKLPPCMTQKGPGKLVEKPVPGEGGGSGLAGVVAAAFVIAAIIVGVRYIGAGDELAASKTNPVLDEEDAAVAAPIVVPPRCKTISSEAFVVGDKPTTRARTDAGADEVDEEFDELAPYAVELGRGAVTSDGFAVGALRDGDGGSYAMVARIGADGRNGKLMRLGRSRGDFDAPTVTGYKDSVLAAMLEPNAGGRAIRVAKVTGDQVTWGPEVSEGRDESLAVDIATSGDRAVLVWDDVSKDGKRTMIMIESFDPQTMRSEGATRPISSPKNDAELPRLAPRPGGYWLAYAVVGEGKRPKDEDTGLGGEAIQPRWVEVVPLDERGHPVSTPRAITPKDGHALAFDIEASDDGGMILAYRDDDTPSGSTGGKVMTIWVRLSGVGEPQLVTEESNSTGVPDLLPGWMAIASLSGATRLGPLSAKGELLGELRREPEIGNGEVLAATKASLLIARPAGKAMKLSVVECVAEEPTLDGGKPAVDAGP